MEILGELRNSLQDNSNEALLENAKALLRAMGWGAFNFEIQNRIGKVTVIYPPTFNGEVVSGVDFIDGIAEVIIKLLNSGTRMTVYRETYDKFDRTLTLDLVETNFLNALTNLGFKSPESRHTVECP